MTRELHRTAAVILAMCGGVVFLVAMQLASHVSPLGYACGLGALVIGVHAWGVRYELTRWKEGK